MEIRDLVQANRRRLWALVFLPLLAGLVAFIILDSQPRQYEAELTVTVPASNDTVGTNTQYVANFRQVLRSSQLGEAVAKETGVSEANIAEKLTSSQVAGSNRIRMKMRSPRPGESSRVVETAARLASEQLEGPERQVADARVAGAQAAVAAAEAAYNEKRVARDKLIAATDQVLPPETYQTKAGRLAQLEDQLQQALLEGLPPDPIAATAVKKRNDALQAVVGQRRKELTALGEVVRQFQSLTADLDRAETALAAAQSELHEVTREHRQEPASLGKPQEELVGRLPQLARGVGTAMGLAVLFALGIFFYPELRRALRPAPQPPYPDPYPMPYPQRTRIYVPTGLEPARGLAIASLPRAPDRAGDGHGSTDASSRPAHLWTPPGSQARTSVEEPPLGPRVSTAEESTTAENSAATADQSPVGDGGPAQSPTEEPGDLHPPLERKPRTVVEGSPSGPEQMAADELSPAVTESVAVSPEGVEDAGTAFEPTPAEGVTAVGVSEEAGSAGADAAAQSAGAESATYVPAADPVDPGLLPGVHPRTTAEPSPPKSDEMAADVLSSGGTPTLPTPGKESAGDASAAERAEAEHSVGVSVGDVRTADSSLGSDEVIGDWSAGNWRGSEAGVMAGARPSDEGFSSDAGPAAELPRDRSAGVGLDGRRSSRGLHAKGGDQSIRSVVASLALSERLRRALAVRPTTGATDNEPDMRAGPANARPESETQQPRAGDGR